MNERIRELFENEVYPSFPGLAHGLRRKDNGEYVSDALEDHWQTFQEGIEIAVRECLNQCYNRGMNDELYAGQLKAASYIEKHFGIKE